MNSQFLNPERCDIKDSSISRKNADSLVLLDGISLESAGGDL